MFLQSYQASNHPLMAEIASRNFENPIPGFSLLQEHQSLPSNISTFLNPGVNPIVETTVIGTINSGSSAAKKKRGRDDFSSCFDREMSVKVQKQCLELDRFLALHAENVRAELEARRRSYWRQVAAAVEARVQRMLRGKDEEIESISRRNSALEERMRELLVEGQLWRSLAQANEATVVSLHRELELLLLAPANDVGPSLEEGQGDNGDVYCETSASSAGAREEKEDGDGGAPSSSCCHRRGGDLQGEKEGGGGVCWCKGCGSKEVSVLLLPCRHLCLCAACEPASEACPLCLCPKTATLQVYVT
ncbi:BOI-related E3 ubiquitin-protein ligase 1-like [Nymphaea colorata]|nr:BOI-related E3 ubiquitin-protein ligase 1-like [Nymphaea colorata]